MIEDQIRNYRMTDAELMMFVSNLVGFMRRDDTEFAVKGVTSLLIDTYEAAGNAFEVFPKDEYYKADVSLAVQTKDETRAALEVKVRDVVQLAVIKWGEGSPQYKKFGAAKMTASSDREFLSICRLVVLTATGYLLDLTPVGLDQAAIDDLEDLAQEFEDNLNAISEAMAVRELKTKERITKGNELYADTAHYCEIGKIIWDDVDLGKFNDYIIYPAGSGGATPELPGVPELNYSPDGFSWDEVLTATSYQLMYRLSSDTEWIELYNDIYPPEGVSFEPGEGEWVARLRARNSAGYGNWSEERTVFIGLRAPQNVEVIFTGSPDNFLRVSWSAVTGADFVEIWSSVVALGQPSGTFAKVGQLPSSPFQQVATLGMRYYYYLIAKNAEYTSPQSATVYYDVPV